MDNHQTSRLDCPLQWPFARQKGRALCGAGCLHAILASLGELGWTQPGISSLTLPHGRLLIETQTWVRGAGGASSSTSARSER